jgi:hypothetical protein
MKLRGHVGSIAVVALVLAGGASGARAGTAWLTVRTAAMQEDLGALPTPVAQEVVGRVKLDRISRVSRVTIHGKTHLGDFLVIEGRYENTSSQPSYWSEAYAFDFGTGPKLCTVKTCGPAIPKGDWSLMEHKFGVPILDYPATRSVAGHHSVVFREAVPLPPGKHGIVSMRDVWLLPIYAAFNYYELPFPRSQLVRLSAYFGRTLF